jgi:uncharacterized surface protein with fasciclin (FAS1) repeats
MSLKLNSALLSAFGLLSTGILFANPAALQAQTAPDSPPTVPTIPTMPEVAPPATPTPGTPAPGTPIVPMDVKKPPMSKPSMKPVMTKPDAPAETTTEMKTIVELASSNGSFKTLTAALTAAGLTEALSGKGPFTVFAPTDAAFAALPKGTVEMLLKPENKSKLVKLLTYHVVPGTALSTELKNGAVKSLQGSSIQVKVDPKGVMINNAKVVIADVKASNGVIHAIDKVIIPMPPKPMTRRGTTPKSVTPKATEKKMDKTIDKTIDKTPEKTPAPLAK